MCVSVSGFMVFMLNPFMRHGVFVFGVLIQCAGVGFAAFPCPRGVGSGYYRTV